jgi:hypothetical protein
MNQWLPFQWCLSVECVDSSLDQVVLVNAVVWIGGGTPNKAWLGMRGS